MWIRDTTVTAHCLLYALEKHTHKKKNKKKTKKKQKKKTGDILIFLRKKKSTSIVPIIF